VPRWIAGVLDPLIGVVIAPDCAACGQPLDRPTSGPVCRDCWNSIHRFTPPVCRTCGDPLPPELPPAGPADERSSPPSQCHGCRRTPPLIVAARAVGPYEGRLRDIIHAFKYDKRRTLARPLSALMREAGRHVLEGADAAVPVPLHWTRRRRRGFNQAALLASRLGLPLCHALRRSRRTRAQAGLPAGERHLNVSRAFALAWRSRWPRLRPFGSRVPRTMDGLVVVLVDDVSTTGATADACARVLLDSGAREVRVLTVARVASRPR
jgi:ComF family protein